MLKFKLSFEFKSSEFKFFKSKLSLVESKSLLIKSKSLKLALELVSTSDFDLTTLELIFKSKSLALELISTLELNSTLTLKPVSFLKLVLSTSELVLSLELFLFFLELKNSFLLFIKGQEGLEDLEESFKSESESESRRKKKRR